jgi:ribonuclease Y
LHESGEDAALRFAGLPEGDDFLVGKDPFALANLRPLHPGERRSLDNFAVDCPVEELRYGRNDVMLGSRLLCRIKRVEDLEKIGLSFPGVDKCYAVQAGRELRVIVQPDKVTDDQALMLAKSISRKIEEELQYPGQIRVIVVRETRCTEYAK